MEHPHITFLHILTFANLLLLGGVLGASSDHYTNFLDCLTDQFKRSNSATDTIYTPQNAAYASLLASPNLRPASTSPERPDLIVTPLHESEIQAAVYCSKKLSMQIRVRSGGHDYEGLSFTSRIPFVIVDMRNFRSVRINDVKKTAWVQVGATLDEFYHTIARKSRTLAFTAGVCPSVGVGGHFSGGGYGMMSRKHAIAADRIIDARVMNADGKILHRRTMGEDHFWAIRGGGGTSFGIVIEFKVRLVTVPETVTVFNVTRIGEENVTSLVHRWQYIAHKADENLLLRLYLNAVPVSGNRTIAASFITLYLGRVKDLLPIMQEEFPELGLTEQDCTEMSWIESVPYFAGGLQQKNQSQDILLETTTNIKTYFKGKSDFVSTPIPENGLRGIWQFLYEEGYTRLQFSPYGGVLNTFSESETPFPHRAGNIFMAHYGVAWFTTANNESERRMDWIRRLYSYMEPYVTNSPRAAYFNYRDLDIGMNNNDGNASYNQASVWGKKYFKNNFKRLVRVKTKVDPSNFFRNEQSIPPLVHA